MKNLYYRFIYRRLMKFMHRYNWHHMTRNDILERDYTIHWCQWCGVRGKTAKER